MKERKLKKGKDERKKDRKTGRRKKKGNVRRHSSQKWQLRN